MAQTNPQVNLQQIDANKLQGLLTGPGRQMIEAKLAVLPPTIQPQAMAAFQEFVAKTRIVFASSMLIPLT